MIFRQLLQPLSSTCIYLIGCEDSGQAAPINPAGETVAHASGA
jgi:hypothetical protein